MSRVGSYLSEMEAVSLIGSGRFREALEILLRIERDGDWIDRSALLKNIAQCHLHLQDFGQARRVLEDLVRIRPDDTDARYNLGYALLSLQDYSGAAEILDSLKREEKATPDTIYNLGFARLGLGDLDGAMANFRALAGMSVSPALVYNIGISLIGMDKPREAREIFVLHLERNPRDVDATFGLGLAYSKLGEDRKAIECLQRVIRWDGRRYPSAYVSAALSFFRIGETAKSLEYLTEAVRLEPGMAEAWYYLGYVRESAGQTGEAIENYRKAGDLDHTLSDVWQRLGELYVRERRYDEARISLKKAFRITNDTAVAYRLALVLMAEKNHAEAVSYLQACLKGPGVPGHSVRDVSGNLAVCHYHLGEYSRAVEAGLGAGPTESRGVFLLFVMGSSYLKLGDVREARRYLALGLDRDPKDVNILFTLGVLEANLENYAKARDYLSRALICQRSPDIIYALALAEMKLGRSAEAAALFREYQEAHRTDPDILYKLGLIFLELGDRPLARRAFEQTLRNRPQDRKARDYLRSLESE